MFAPFHRNRSGRWVNVFTGGTQQCSAVYSATCCNWCSMLIGDLLEREIILLAKDRIWICGYLPTTYSLHTHSYSYFIHRTQCRSCIFDRVVFFLFFSLVLHSFVLFWPFRFHCCCCCFFFYFFYCCLFVRNTTQIDFAVKVTEKTCAFCLICANERWWSDRLICGKQRRQIEVEYK